MRYTNTLEWLDAFLQKSLSQEDQKILEEKLLNDTAFKEEFATYLATYQADQKAHKQELRQTYFIAKKKKRRQLIQVAAAACLILFIPLFWFLQASSFANPQEIYALYQDQEINLSNKTSDGNLLAVAEQQYKAKDYAAALKSFDSFLEANPDSPQVLLYKAITLRHIDGQESQALAIFKELATSAPLFQQEAQWQAALTYLKMGEVAACRQSLVPLLSSKEEYYVSRARRLQGELDRLK